MIQNLLGSILEKLADDGLRKFKDIWGVGEQVEKLKSELRWIQVFLKDADRKKIRDEGQKHWVNEVIKVAYNIEDVIDNAILLDAEVSQETTSNQWPVVRMFKKPRKLPALCKLGDQINNIVATIEEISKNRIKYGINNLGEGSGGEMMLPLKPPMLPDIDDPNVIGFDVHTDNVVKLLVDKSTQKRSVVSIVGIGGLGKSTLARKAYNSINVKENFNLRMWVTVSQKFEWIDILRRILEQIRHVEMSELGKEKEYFLSQLHKSLAGKKYLLVLDDVWTEELWVHIEETIADENNGSRVLITSRDENVARTADPTLDPYKLPFLSEEQGLQLLLRKACYNPNLANNAYCSDLIDIARQLVGKCCGLPLALVVLGGLLSKKPQEYTAWSKLFQTMSWRTDGSRCSEILATSYDDLPLALKFCFTYFAAFPEDYGIDDDQLIRLWIAEGFIPQEENRTLEDTAERFLEDLVQRSMVQVYPRSYDRPIKDCHVHDLLRDLAIQKAKENFLVVYSNFDDEQSCGGARRVAVHHSNCDGLVKYAGSNLRSVLCFNSQLPNCSGFKLLKVLCEMKWKYLVNSTWHERIEELTQLRLLKLYCNLDTSNQVQFVKMISGMKYLQTLDLRSTECDNLSDFLWDIETLRHVILVLSSRPLGPPAGANLRNLHTLIGIKNRESWKLGAVPNLPNLRKLEIKITKGSSWEVVVAFLSSLKNLVELRLIGDGIPIEIIDMRAFPFYKKLTSLLYQGEFYQCTEVALDVAMFPIHLTMLDLYFSIMQQDPMTVLEKLHELKWLRITNGIHDDVKQMRCSAGGFLHLQYLHICGVENMEEWKIEENAMTMLQVLEVDECPMLQVPSGLQHLTELHMLSWSFYGDPLAITKAEKIRKFCRHVPHLDISTP